MCGTETRIEFSPSDRVPWRDATCAVCGCLLRSYESVLRSVIDNYETMLGVKPGRFNEMTSILDFGADSLDTVEMVMELEERYDINIPDEEAEEIETIGDAARFIEKQLSRQ